MEELAAIEHEQWVFWSKTLAETENLSPERLARWKALWIPYEQLTEETKEHDRVWARKVLAVALRYAKQKLEARTLPDSFSGDIRFSEADWLRIWRELGVEK